jgi:hypothetical protein
MKSISITLEVTTKPPKEPVNTQNKVEFWKCFNVNEPNIQQKEDRINTFFPIYLSQTIKEKIQQIRVCDSGTKEVWANNILQKTIKQKVEWWDDIKMDVENGKITYGSISFVLEFIADKYLPDIFEYSLVGFEILVKSCLQHTFEQAIETRLDGESYSSDWILTFNDELTAAFYSPPLQSEQSSDSPSTSHTSPQLPPPPSTPANGTNLSSSGSGAIQIINDFSSGLPGNSTAVMRSSGATEKVMTTAAAAPENMTHVSRTAARTLNGIDPLKALALVVTIISIVVSSLVVMEYNAEKHRYQDMEKVLLDKYEALLSQYGKLLKEQGKPE